MKTASLLALLIFSLVKLSHGQSASMDRSENRNLYALALNENSTTNKFLPKTLVINGNMLSYISEFLAQQSVSPSLKKYILENGWGFAADIDTAGWSKAFKKINIRKLKGLLNPDLIIKKNFRVNYNFSPVIFSKDLKRAILICQESANHRVLGLTVYFFMKEAENWRLVKAQIPYYI